VAHDAKVEQDKHGPISASQATQRILHPRSKDIHRHRNTCQSNAPYHLAQEEFEREISADLLLFAFGKLAEDNIVPWDMLLKIRRNTMEF
jgi:hypothetical protein